MKLIASDSLQKTKTFIILRHSILFLLLFVKNETTANELRKFDSFQDSQNSGRQNSLVKQTVS